MNKPRIVHPADAANAKTLASAVRYDVALFLGTGRYASRSALADLDINSGKSGKPDFARERANA